MFKIFEIGIDTGEWESHIYQYGTFFQFGDNSSIGVRIKDEEMDVQEIVGERQEGSVNDTNLKWRLRTYTAAIPEKKNNLNIPDVERKMILYPDPEALNMRMTTVNSINGSPEGDVDTYLVIINNNFQMIRYDTTEDICSTFRTKAIFGKDNEKYDKAYGCYIQVNTKVTPNTALPCNLLRIQGCIGKGKNTKFIHAGLRVNEEGKIEVMLNQIKNEMLISGLKKSRNRMKTQMYFRPTISGIRTNIIIGPNEDDPIWNKVGDPEEFFTDHVYPSMMQYDPNTYPNEDAINFIPLSKESDGKKWSDADIKMVENEMMDTRPKRRAITIFGNILPDYVLKKLHPLYVFRMDETGKVTCIRSN